MCPHTRSRRSTIAPRPTPLPTPVARQRLAAWACSLLLGLGAFGASGGAAAADVVPWSAEAAPAWTALFDRSTGWTGADGVYSIPLNGWDRPGQGPSPRTLVFFSDTFVGTVNPDGSRSNTVMVNNSTALVDGAMPAEASIQFNVRTDARGRAQSMVVPRRPDDPSERFWPTDGLVHDGVVHVFAWRIQDAPTPPFAFVIAGASMLLARADDPVPFSGRYGELKAPLFVPAAADGTGELYFGSAVLPMTREAGAVRPDGHVYVYGYRSRSRSKALVVARVPVGQLRDFAAYRFWDGSAWVADLNQSANLGTGVSTEFSVHALPDGRFLLVHMTEPLGRTVAVRYGASPVGPWGKDIPVWEAPEATLTPNTFVYGAKAHPHWSRPGELLISYHVNTFDFGENFGAGGSAIYRPRFIRLPLP